MSHTKKSTRLSAKLILLSFGLTLAACGGGSLTASEYAEEIEGLVGAMEERFAEADAQWEVETPSLEGALRYWAERLDIREDFLEDIEALEIEIAEVDVHSLDAGRPGFRCARNAGHRVADLMAAEAVPLELQPVEVRVLAGLEGQAAEGFEKALEELQVFFHPAALPGELQKLGFHQAAQRDLGRRRRTHFAGDSIVAAVQESDAGLGVQ